MKAKVSSRAILLPALALFALPGLGQEPLTLFQDDGRGSAQGGASFEPNTPGVILKGIYRFGDTYHVSLQSGDSGAVQQFKLQQGQSVSVFDGYQLQVGDTRNVVLGLPPGMSCQSNPQFGSSCVGRNQMSVTFAQTDPTRRTQNRSNNNNNNRSSNNNRNDNRPPWDRNNNNNEWFNARNDAEIRALIETARNNPAERERVEAMLRDRMGRGGNTGGNNGPTITRGGRGGGGFDNNTGGPGGRGGGGGGFNNNTGGRGGGGGGRGGGGFGP